MVRKTTVEYAENPAGGTGSLEKYHIVSAEELNGHGKMFAKIVRITFWKERVSS